MDEHMESALIYGHPGRPIYSSDTKSWSFPRSFTRAPAISYAGLAKTVIPSPQRSSHHRLFGPYGRPPNSNSIPQALPDLGVQWSSDIREHKFSKFITKATDIYDPHVSTLLDLGYALDIGQEGANHIPVAAAVTGECGNILSLRLLVENAADLQFEGSKVNVPTIGDTETAEWSTQGVPIRQVCFSQPAEDYEAKATWMAARLPESTTIFRPLYERNIAPRYLPRHDPAAFPSTLQTSYLDANPVTEILSTHTGGFPHVAVSFNPWYQRQVAILDTRGNWSLWDIQTRHKRRKANGLASPRQKGSLPSIDLENTNNARHDGWGSIQWIGDFSTILVADRRCVMVFQMDGDEVRSRAVELALGKQSEWVLDVQRSRRSMSQFFVLTTTRLLWFDLRTASLDEEGLRLPLQHSLAWRHYRDPEDTTLRVSEISLSRNSYFVLYSRLTELVEVYSCAFTGDAPTETIITPDPFLLHIPPVGTRPVLDKSTRYSTFVFKEINHPSALGTSHHSPDMTLINLYWSDSSHAVHESLFKCPLQSLPKQVSVDSGDAAESRAVLGAGGPHTFRTYLDDSENSDDDDSDGDDEDSADYNGFYGDGSDLNDFIVEDGTEPVVPPSPPPRSKNFFTSSSDETEWTMNWTRVYRLAVANIASGSNPMGSEGRPTFAQLIRELESETPRDAEYRKNGETTLEISGGRPVSNDMEKITEDLQRLASIAFPGRTDTQPQSRLITLPLQFSSLFPGMPVASRAGQISQDFSETYDRLVKEWLTNLPQDVPLLTRRMKERIVRGVSLDLLLSRLIQINNDPTGIKPSQTVENATAVEGTQDSGRRLPSSQFPATQDTVTDNQDTNILRNKTKETTSSAYSSLCTFTTFKDPRPRSRNVANLLSHWQSGIDPSDYDWEKASQAQGDGGVLGLDRSRRRSRKKRSQLSQQTPALDRLSLPPTPVAPMIRTWGSQPDQALLMPSSQPTVDEAPMTQTERGQFGARDVTKNNKTKKKRRAGGF